MSERRTTADAERDVMRYVDGEMDLDRRQAFERRLAEDGDLRKRAEDARRLDEEVRAALSETPALTTDAVARSAPPRKLGRWWLGAAAVVLAAVTVGPLLHRPDPAGFDPNETVQMDAAGSADGVPGARERLEAMGVFVRSPSEPAGATTRRSASETIYSVYDPETKRLQLFEIRREHARVENASTGL